MLAVQEMRVKFDVPAAFERFGLTFRERLAEWGVAAELAIWGLLVVNSPGLFDRPFYAPLKAAMTQQQAGWCAFAIGTFHVTWLGINGLYRPSARWRAMCCALGSVFWVYLLVGALSVGWRSSGSAIYAGNLLLSVISGWFAAADYHRAGYARRKEGSDGGRG